MPFVKLDCGILNSTLWAERGQRDVFITALLMAEPFEVTEPLEQIEARSMQRTGFVVPPGWYGFVKAAGPGIVRAALAPMEEGMAALEELGRPDPESRSADFEGRRLVRVDGGYVVLNYMRYREKDATAADRARRYRQNKAARESAAKSYSGRSQQQDVEPVESRRDSHAVTRETSPCRSRCRSTVLESTDTSEVVAGNRADSPAQLDCPHAAILDAWKRSLPELSQHDPELWAGTRADHLRARWRERASVKGWKTQQEGLEYFAKLFVWIRDSDWLMGRVGGGDGRAFKMTLEWLVMPSNWAKVLEGKYHANSVAPAPPVSAKDRERKAIVDKWMGEFAQAPKPATIDADATPQQNLVLGG